MLKIIEIVSNLISKLRNSANGKCECDYINGAETLPPPLSKEEEAKTLGVRGVPMPFMIDGVEY